VGFEGIGRFLREVVVKLAQVVVKRILGLLVCGFWGVFEIFVAD
jgi:hypothetical protein